MGKIRKTSYGLIDRNLTERAFVNEFIENNQKSRSLNLDNRPD